MIKILITGSSGFVGKSLVYLFDQDNIKVDSLNHKDLELTDSRKIKDYLQKNHYDIIINTAIKGGRRIREDNLYDYWNNVILFENLIKNRGFYGNLIFFGSGFEYDKSHNIYKVKEEQFRYLPQNFYAASKFVNMYEARVNNFGTNLRIFNMFGNDGLKESFMFVSLNNYINHLSIEIWKNYYFDSIYIEDLYKIVKHFINNPPQGYYELNCVYKKKYLMSEVAKIINSLSNYRVPIIIKKKYNWFTTNNYCGNGTKLDKLNLSLEGLEKGILKSYEYLINNGTK